MFDLDLDAILPKFDFDEDACNVAFEAFYNVMFVSSGDLFKSDDDDFVDFVDLVGNLEIICQSCW